jgi:hypothetical protein
MLEQQLQHLRDVRARVSHAESQLLQLRQEIRDGLSAIREEMKAVEATSDPARML